MISKLRIAQTTALAILFFAFGVSAQTAAQKRKQGLDQGGRVLKAPQVEPLNTEALETAAPANEAAAAAEPSPEPGPEPEPESTPVRPLPPPKKVTEEKWSKPQSVFEVHGYFRMRGEYQNNFSIGRSLQGNASSDPPFSNFRPLSGAPARGGSIQGGCEDSNNGGTGTCGGKVLSYANMRVRLVPELHLSDYVRIKMWVDALDNMVLGTAPDSFAPATTDAVTLSRNYPIDGLNSTVLPPEHNVNALQDSIVVRRAWAEVRPHDVVELRFGRMGWHWGLGMLFNEGADFDGDYSTEVDRVMAITKLAGFYWLAAYDFAFEGLQRRNGVYGLPYDASQKDDVDQVMLGVSYQESPDVEKRRLSLGGATVKGGLMAVHRSQQMSAVDGTLQDSDASNAQFTRRGLSLYTFDAWGEFRFRGFRLSGETAWRLGSIENVSRSAQSNNNSLDILQWGAALEAEYRLASDKLGIYFYTGYASGDGTQEEPGLSSENNLLAQRAGNGKISTFTFHPNYRVDLILWRNLMRRVAGAYYLRPGISYDIWRTDRGQLLGGRLDIIWSRAARAAQTWGNAEDLGLEIDASIYYRSEDGPELTDGFFSGLQAGLLFPMAGLGYREGAYTSVREPSVDTAFALRLLLGVLF